MAYATVAQFKAEINLLDTSETWTATITRLLDTATRNIDRFCNRPDGFTADDTASAHYYVGSGKPYQLVDDFVELSAVAVKDSASDDEDEYTAWTIGTLGTTAEADVFAATGDPKFPDYVTTPYTMLVVGANGDYAIFTSGEYSFKAGFRPYTTVPGGVPTVKVTAKWGYATETPADIVEACIMQAARWFKRLQSAMSDTLASGDMGTLMYTQSLDPDIKRILVDGRYVKPMTGRR
jgi:hypothetical protein